MDPAIIIALFALGGTGIQALTSHRSSRESNWHNRAIELTKDDINKFDKAFFSGLQYYSKLQDLASSLGALAKQMRADGINFSQLAEGDKAIFGVKLLKDHSNDPEAIRDLKNTAFSVFTLLGSDRVNAVLSDEPDHAYQHMQEQFFAQRKLPSLEEIEAFNDLLDKKLACYSAAAKLDRESLRNAFWRERSRSFDLIDFTRIFRGPMNTLKSRGRK
ncbi:hypothetical protein [Synechococcus sp. MW101C3]|uniref:hypothetical protein n=1 Tax=Synechococcus sp. MW101C3 TaxID=210768 RepID=UPI000B99A97B|nr:hypothetical protein [Synechococcus sp. MW101C3]